MTALAIVGIALFGIAVVVIVMSYVLRTVREFRVIRRVGLRVRLEQIAAELPEATAEASARSANLPVPPAPPPPAAELPPAPPGWGFDRDR